MAYEIYVISNADLFREGLNAVAAFCGSEGFKATTWTGAALGIIMTALAYVKQHDVLVFLKWLVSYFFVFINEDTNKKIILIAENMAFRA